VALPKKRPFWQKGVSKGPTSHFDILTMSFSGQKYHFFEDLLSDSAKNGRVERACSYCICGPLLEGIYCLEEKKCTQNGTF
jgi:hypothetical protein